MVTRLKIPKIPDTVWDFWTNYVLLKILLESIADTDIQQKSIADTDIDTEIEKNHKSIDITHKHNKERKNCS